MKPCWRSRWSCVVLCVCLGSAAVLAADRAVGQEGEVSGADRRGWAQQRLDALQKTCSRVTRLLEDARDSGDANAIQCLNTSLTQLHATQRNIEQALENYTAAERRGETDRANEVFGRISRLNERYAELINEADACSRTTVEMSPEVTLSGPDQVEWAASQLEEIRQTALRVAAMLDEARHDNISMAVDCLQGPLDRLTAIISDFERSRSEHAAAERQGDAGLRDQRYQAMMDLATQARRHRAQAARCVPEDESRPRGAGGCCGRAAAPGESAATLFGVLVADLF